jgi:hypothetical protein
VKGRIVAKKAFKAKGIAMVLYFVKLDMLDNKNISI